MRFTRFLYWAGLERREGRGVGAKGGKAHGESWIRDDLMRMGVRYHRLLFALEGTRTIWSLVERGLRSIIGLLSIVEKLLVSYDRIRRHSRIQWSMIRANICEGWSTKR